MVQEKKSRHLCPECGEEMEVLHEKQKKKVLPEVVIRCPSCGLIQRSGVTLDDFRDVSDRIV